ncbi:TraR/DksA C4-type zinc finger protein [Marinobacterium sp. D7]|uniref:TraR/DksA family transcriptional regulator n=1 Tax=Marinobacterium ramblicola TaxID=2849041 RepID=UPI001C2D8BB8|nr:TraR/DksA C4-type zinc finger protein [Marinobacterium ramblicola]
MNRSDLNNLRRSLDQLRSELEADLSAIHPAADCGNLARDAADELCCQIEHDLQRVDSAIERIETGLYGYCVGCGEEIELNQLRADPTTSFCLSCNSRLQRRASHK